MQGLNGFEDRRFPSPEGGAEEAELRALLRRSVDALPRAQREVFVLRNDEGLSYSEIAEVLGWTETNARSNFYQALKSLRRRMEEVLR